MEISVTSDRCPRCGHSLTRPGALKPWCTACEWNLGVYDPEVVPPFGWRWFERISHDVAFRLDRRLFVEYARHPPVRPGWTAARVILVAVSATLVLLILACLCLGIWLLSLDFPSWAIVPGVVLILLAFALRPRLTPVPERRRTLARETAPALFALFDRVAAAAGATPPELIAVDPDYNAATARVGLRQRSMLVIGIPLWITLSPQLRVALLAHELAHGVNGDPTRALVVRPALDTFRELALSTGADRTTGEIASPDRDAHAAVVFGELVLLATSRVFLLAYLGLCALAARDQQRAEYLADAMAADIAGSDAVVELMDRLVLLGHTVTLIGYNAPTASPARWRGMAEALYSRRSADLPSLRQLTMRQTSLRDSHPPAGLRARLVEGWGRKPAAVTASDEECARIDAELAGWYGATHRRLLGAEAFRGDR